MAHRFDNLDAEHDFRLDVWLVKPASNEIVDQHESRRLEHKVMRLLVFFVQDAGRDLSREEILRGVWGDGVHSEEVLTVAVSSLRKALGDDPKSPRFIKTVPRYGYHMLQAADAVAQKSPPSPLWRRLAQRLGLRFLIMAALLGLFLLIVLVQIIVKLVYWLGQ